MNNYLILLMINNYYKIGKYIINNKPDMERIRTFNNKNLHTYHYPLKKLIYDSITSYTITRYFTIKKIN